MRKVFLLLPVIVVCLASVANAQEESETVSLPDYVMKQVVERAVIEHFTTSHRKGEIYLSEMNIKSEWIPAMKKIKFVFVEKAEGREIHFFREPRRFGEIYELSFGWGDPACDASGETWQFRLIRGEVRDFRLGSSGWGSGCGHVSGS